MSELFRDVHQTVVRKITRKEFLTISGLTLMQIALSGKSFEWKMAQVRSQEESSAYTPGFIENSVQEQFITLRGHKDWLSTAVRVPFVNTLSQRILLQMDAAPTHWNRLDRMLTHSFDLAREQLLEAFPTTQFSRFDEGSTHAGLISLAGVVNNFIPYETFCMDTSQWGQSGNISDQLWGPYGLGRKSFPPLLPGSRNESGIESNGYDRSMHFIHHALISYLLLYSSKHNLGLEREMLPLIQQIYTGAESVVRPISKALLAEVVSNALGYVHELKGTVKDIVKGNKGITDQGIYDPEVQADYEANRLGALCGYALFQGKHDLVFSVLTDERLYSSKSKMNVPKDIFELLTN